jgi:hypothetical protein
MHWHCVYSRKNKCLKTYLVLGRNAPLSRSPPNFQRYFYTGARPREASCGRWRPKLDFHSFQFFNGINSTKLFLPVGVICRRRQICRNTAASGMLSINFSFKNIICSGFIKTTITIWWMITTRKFLINRED